MPIIPWKPFWDIDKFFEEDWPEDWFDKPRWGLRKWLEETPMIRTPRMDIYEKDNNVIAEVELPGIDSKDIEVEVKDNVLRIEAKAEEKKEEKGKGYWRKESGTKYFKRQVALPAEVIGEKAEAEYKDGILKVMMPKKEIKKEEKKPITIKVKGKK